PLAFAAFEAGPRVAEIFPDVLRDAFVACKRQELNTFALNVSDFEIETYLESV
ncbi:MAG: glutamine synthetase, partial [Mesorhizobium sp.]